MARNGALVPESKDKLNGFKSEVASSLNINLKQGYNGDLTSRDAGSRENNNHNGGHWSINGIQEVCYRFLHLGRIIDY